MKNLTNLAVALILLPLIACGQADQTGSTAKDVNVKEFAELIQGDGIILDVRTPEEHAEGAIPGAVNLDFQGADFAQQLEGLDKAKPVYVYCAKGGRSSKAMAMMQEKGFSAVYNLDGGYTAWAESQ